MLLPRTTGEMVESELDWFFRRDGSMFRASWVSVPLEMHEGRGAVVAFTDIEQRLRAEQVLHEHDAALAKQQTSLQRIATLVAAGAASEECSPGSPRRSPSCSASRSSSSGAMSLTAAQACSQTGATVCMDSRRVAAGPSTARAQPHWFSRRPASQDRRLRERTQHDQRCRARSRDDFGRRGPDRRRRPRLGQHSTGQIERRPLPDRIEDRLAEFTELVATAISNTSSREELALLADEQGALRRVATLVAQGVPPADVFAVVAEEVGRLMSSIDITSILRYEPDGTATVIATWREGGADVVPVGTRLALDGESARTTVLRSGRPVRIDWRGETPAHSRRSRARRGFSPG